MGLTICLTLSATTIAVVWWISRAERYTDMDDWHGANPQGMRTTGHDVGKEAAKDGDNGMDSDRLRGVAGDNLSIEREAMNELTEIELTGGGPLDGKVEPLFDHSQSSTSCVHKTLGIVHRYDRTDRVINGRIAFELVKTTRAGEAAK